MMPLFFKTAPEESTGLISMAKVAGLPLKGGSFSKKTPRILVIFRSQSLPSLKYCNSLSSAAIIYYKLDD
jgi:hypothetical protein